MVAWETMDLAAEAPYLGDYQQIWRAADKVVYSTTLRRSAVNARVSSRCSIPPPSGR